MDRQDEWQARSAELGAAYASPPRKLVRFFAQSRKQWKAKCRAAKAMIKLQKNRIRFLEGSKARWMNVEVVVRWGTRALAFLDAPPREPSPGWDPTLLAEKLGWVARFRPQLQLWAELLQLSAVPEHFVRTHSLERGAPQHLRKLLAPVAQTPRTKKVRAQLLTFVTGEAAKAAPRERLLGSSEVIESVFGKFKRLEHTQAKSGFTGLLLTMSAMVAQTSREVVRQALETVPTKRVWEWCKQTLGDSLQAQRKKALGQPAHLEQNSDQEQEAA